MEASKEKEVIVFIHIEIDTLKTNQVSLLLLAVSLTLRPDASTCLCEAPTQHSTLPLSWAKQLLRDRTTSLCRATEARTHAARALDDNTVTRGCRENWFAPKVMPRFIDTLG